MSEVGRDYPVVMRMAGLWPKDIGGYEGHRTRKGGDLGHVHHSRSHLNGPPLIGRTTWAQEIRDEISKMRLENHANELEKLQKQRRTNELAKRMAEGPRDPWRATRHGPLREVILTANARWFEDDLTDFLGDSGPTREEQFEALAVEWLKTVFGEDCVHARADRDEEAYHVHAVIVPRTRTKDGRRMLQPSKHPVIRDYEAGQDSVGAWFAAAQIGLTRGERRKQKIREAMGHNANVRKTQGEAAPGGVVEDVVPIPEHRRHVSPRRWREEQDRALAERDERLSAREARANKRDAALVAREADLEQREETVERKERCRCRPRDRPRCRGGPDRGRRGRRGHGRSDGCRADGSQQAGEPGQASVRPCAWLDADGG